MGCSASGSCSVTSRSPSGCQCPAAKLPGCGPRPSSRVAPARRSSMASEVVSSLSMFGVLQLGLVKVPLSEREIYTVMRSWDSVSKRMTETGITMFVRMFQTAPAVQEAFEKFRTLDDVGDLSRSSVMETHGMVVMSAIDEIINSLDDERALVTLIIEQGRSHARFGDLTDQLFWAIEEPFLEAVQCCFEANNWTRLIQELYKKTIRFILKTLVTGFRYEIDSRRQQEAQFPTASCALGEAAGHVITLAVSPGHHPTL